MSLFDLFRPKRKHSNWHVREVAVKKLTDQKLLADIAKNDKKGDVREAAVEKLTDLALLARIASDDNDEDVRAVAVRHAAVEWVSNPDLLNDIANNSKYEDVQLIAKFLLNQIERNGKRIASAAAATLVAEIPKATFTKTSPPFTEKHHETWDSPSPDWDVKRIWTEKIMHREGHLREVRAISNPALLADIAKKAKDDYVRKAAVEKLTDQKFLADIAKNDAVAFVRNMAERRLDNLKAK